MSGSPDDPFAQRPAHQDEPPPLQLPLATRRFGARTAVLEHELWACRLGCGSQTVGDRP